MGGKIGLRVYQSNIYLKRRIAQQPQQLGLCGDLRRHHVEDRNLQRTNILCRGAILCHHEDIFIG